MQAARRCLQHAATAFGTLRAEARSAFSPRSSSPSPCRWSPSRSTAAASSCATNGGRVRGRLQGTRHPAPRPAAPVPAVELPRSRPAKAGAPTAPPTSSLRNFLDCDRAVETVSRALVKYEFFYKLRTPALGSRLPRSQRVPCRPGGCLAPVPYAVNQYMHSTTSPQTNTLSLARPPSSSAICSEPVQTVAAQAPSTYTVCIDSFQHPPGPSR